MPTQPVNTTTAHPENTKNTVCAGTKHKVKTIRKGTTPIICDGCSDHYHKRCTEMPRDTLEALVKANDTWTCKSCLNPESREFTTEHPVGEEVAEKTKGTTKSSLRILSWNANGVGSKIPELKQRLKDDDIDICLVQESLLRPHQPTPNISDYSAIRTDRKAVKGGGTIAYVKKTLITQRVQESAIKATESSTFKVKMGNNRWIMISNVYVPPPHSSGQEIQFQPGKIPTPPNSLITGDFNSHSTLWDPIKPADDRGTEIINWVLEKELTILNDGSDTRINKAVASETTGGKSTPDITLVGETWRNKCSWTVGEQLSNSDHLPILIVVNAKTKHQQTTSTRAKWRRNEVIWDDYKAAVESNIGKNHQDQSLKARVLRFNEALTEAARKHVGRVKPKKKFHTIMTPNIRAALRKRNRLRQHVHGSKNREEWLEACREAQEEIRKTKEQSWQDFLQDAVTEADDTKLWSLIRTLNGCPDTNSPNEAMNHKGKVITSNARKADIFASHYAAVSRLQLNKEDRSVRRELKKRLNGQSVDGVECSDFSIGELNKALRKMRRKGAEGPDEIPPAFLKELGPTALNELLAIVNQSFREGSCPQVWRNSIIVPLLKAEKPASMLASYRPISLTSCVVKLMERMVAERLYHIAETSNMLNAQQAGFRKGRGCDDQIARVIQAIEDGFQRSPFQRSCLALLDFSKAYDMVWKEKLLVTMIDKGVPMTMIRWLNSFLENRQSRVRVNGTLGHNHQMRQGLPQGAVLSPVLFLFYINTLAEILPDQDMINALFADDVTLLAVRPTLQESQEAVQKSVDIVVQWAKEWKLQLNATKSEVSFFSNSTKETPKTFTPTIMIDGQAIPFNPKPRLLGVILDRQLSFVPHIEKIEEQTKSKLKLLLSLSNTNWGCRRDQLMKIYNAHYKSVVNYAGFAWQPSLRPSNVVALDRLKRHALRVVTGQFARCPKEAPFLEVRETSTAVEIERNAVKAAEKAVRLPETHPRRIAFERSAERRLMKDNWACMAKRLLSNMSIDSSPREPLKYYDVAPWTSARECDVRTTLKGITGKNDSEANKINAAYDAINKENPAYTIYTDGSAAGGLTEGGSAVILTTGPPDALTIVHTIRTRGAKHTSSYEEELAAMEDAASLIVERALVGKIMICTDSQSLCRAIIDNNRRTHTIQKTLGQSEASVVIQWIPGHSNIPGNEHADEAAKDATTLQAAYRPTTFSSACAAIRQEIRERYLSHHVRTAEVYSHISKTKEQLVKKRSDQVTLARLRSGHHKAFKEFHHRLDQTVDPICPKCGEDQHTLEHWFLQCESTWAAKREIFGDDSDMGLGLMTKSPIGTLTLARRTLLGEVSQ